MSPREKERIHDLPLVEIAVDVDAGAVRHSSSDRNESDVDARADAEADAVHGIVNGNTDNAVVVVVVAVANEKVVIGDISVRVDGIHSVALALAAVARAVGVGNTSCSW